MDSGYAQGAADREALLNSLNKKEDTTFIPVENGTETKTEHGYFVELSGLGQLVAFAERMSELTVSIRPTDIHWAMNVDCDATEEEYIYAPTLVVR